MALLPRSRRGIWLLAGAVWPGGAYFFSVVSAPSRQTVSPVLGRSEPASPPARPGRTRAPQGLEPVIDLSVVDGSFCGFPLRPFTLSGLQLSRSVTKSRPPAKPPTQAPNSPTWRPVPQVSRIVARRTLQ